MVVQTHEMVGASVIPEPFASSRDHLLAELERIDLLIQAQVGHARRVHASDDQFRGLYISEAEVDALLQQPTGRPRWLATDEAESLPLANALGRMRRQIDSRRAQSREQGMVLRLDRLKELFDLDGFESDVLLICMAADIDLRYERLYAYLQDDVTKKRPSVDLLLDLMTASVDAKLENRRYFLPDARLMRHRLLEFSPDPGQGDPPLLAKYLKADQRIVDFLLGYDEPDHRLRPSVELVRPQLNNRGTPADEAIKSRLNSLLDAANDAEPVIVHLIGPYGVGKRITAEALCAERLTNLLFVELERLAYDSGAVFEERLSLLGRELKLHQAALYCAGFDGLLQEQSKPLLVALTRFLRSCTGLVFLAGETSWEPLGALGSYCFLRAALRRPDSGERRRLWQEALMSRPVGDAENGIEFLATKFRFSGGQIRDVIVTAENLSRWRDPEGGQLSQQDLYEACRMHSSQKLSALAHKISPKFRWSDLVLPDDRTEQLREVCNYVKFRGRVYDEWGFDSKLALGRGLCVLFAGPSGTGKTMASDIIAGELGLDLYKIDLSAVVSKYIGETEKNLSRIFSEAETSNSILFFDEADALFGKRSEVRDSHDRYANIETGYLLQRMEEYDGVVILATNLRKNMDEAFVRRLHFAVEFPFPSEQDRLRIWKGIWPDDTPLAPDADLDFMARRFDLTGGNIRNIALAAAFMAADGGGAVRMDHLLRATQREHQKMGKVVMEVTFPESSDRGLAR